MASANMSSLAELLDSPNDNLESSLEIGFTVWDDLIDRVRLQEECAQTPCYCDEQIWTFLIGCGYAAAPDGVGCLVQLLTGESRPSRTQKIWFEFRPMSPRLREGTTYLDLALGDVQLRGNRRSGIELIPGERTWICFVEAKWYSDISIDVTHDVERNQLARVIENALCFQSNRQLVDDVFVTLITPALFSPDRDGQRPFSRLYQYKFREYTGPEGVAAVCRDIENCCLEKRDQRAWAYPKDLADRAKKLKLRWVTYDQLFRELPPSHLREQLIQFWTQHGQYQCCGLPLV